MVGGYIVLKVLNEFIDYGALVSAVSSTVGMAV
jgi:hypothetical protein